jgi:mRNA-degrading endonuclease YafQ of YafQ-DinJ toxin-antitoxin module
MKVVQTSTFKYQAKKLHINQKVILDKAIQQILLSPEIGETKKGKLIGIRVYKFQMINQLTLLAYELSSDRMQLILLAIGSHENFYRNLEKK